MLNGAKRSEASPEGYRNLGKSRSCQHSGILQDCFHRAGALESLQRFALQVRVSKVKTEPLYSKRQKKSYILIHVDGSFGSA